MSKSDPENRPDAIVAVRMPADLRDALRAVAETNQRSLSGQVRWLVEQSLLHRDDATSTTATAGLHRKAAA
jgi:hypothetical protein